MRRVAAATLSPRTTIGRSVARFVPDVARRRGARCARVAGPAARATLRLATRGFLAPGDFRAVLGRRVAARWRFAFFTPTCLRTPLYRSRPLASCRVTPVGGDLPAWRPRSPRERRKDAHRGHR